MNSIPFDWSKLIAKTTDESFGIMPDVTFQIVEKMGTKRKLHEVKAHKMILEMVSPTFKTMFYITDVGDKTSEMIQILETTALAFQIVIDAIYHSKFIGESLEGKSVHEVFDVVNVIERYQITELIDIEKEAEKLVMKKTESKKTGMGDKGKNLDPKLYPELEEKFVGPKNEDEAEMAELRREFIEIRMNIQESSIKRKSKTVDPKLEAKAKQFDKMIEEDEID